MEQNIQRKGLVNWLLLLVLGGAGAGVARYADSATGLVASVFLGLGFIVAIVSYLQMRLEERERLERLDFDELKKSTRGASLFAEQALDTFPARRALVQFERYFVPGVAVLLLLLQTVGLYVLWRYLREDRPSDLHQATVAMALYGLFALLYFQVGKYSAVFARLEGLRLLRPQASYLLLGALLSGIATAVAIADWAGHPGADTLVARMLVVLLGLVAVENLVTLVFEIYRPRLRDQTPHPLYESRLIGVLSQPGGLIRTAAQAMDYQFGFKVSETWFYRFLEKALAWLILFQLAALLLASCVVVIEPGQKALLERFGRPVEGRAVLEPGLHLKWPWPLSQVYRYDTERIRTFRLGYIEDEDFERERTVLWTKPHAKEEFNLLVASRTALEAGPEGMTAEEGVPVNLLSANVPIHYEVSDIRAYAYNHQDAGALLQNVANSELTRYLVNVDFYEIMGPGRAAAATELRRRIQQRADELRLGVKILFVGLHGIHPPIKVAPDFEAVIGAIQDAAATNHLARAYAAGIIPTTRAEAAERVNEAEADRVRLVSLANAEAERFTHQLAAYQASPQVYQVLTRLESLSRAVEKARKYLVVPTNTHEVITFNFEDKLRPDLLDITLPSGNRN